MSTQEEEAMSQRPEAVAQTQPEQGQPLALFQPVPEAALALLRGQLFFLPLLLLFSQQLLDS
jgi:hypothetical protein